MKKILLLCCLLQMTMMSAAERIRVACIGNGITAGVNLPHPEQEAYPAQLQQLLGKDYEVMNFGLPSATVCQRSPHAYLHSEMLKQALDFHPDYVVIHLGQNETEASCWPNHQDQFIEDYHCLLDTFRAVNPNTRIWICQMSPIFHDYKGFGGGLRIWFDQIQQQIRQIARTSNVGLIDCFEPLYHQLQLFPDAIHPDKEGAGVLARQTYAALTGDFGGLQLPQTYGNHMVVQREKPIVFRGVANAGEEVKVTWNKVVRQVKTSPEGRWEVDFPAMEAGGPYRLAFEAKSGKYAFEDIWVGEVWLCSGQSNMYFNLKDCMTAKEDLAQADGQERLHLFNMRRLMPPAPQPWPQEILDSVNHLHYILPGTWKRCNATDAANFSAIGYHFGRMLADSLGCHVGLVMNAIGGSNIESWIGRRTMELGYPEMMYDWLNNDLISMKHRKIALGNNKLGHHPRQRHRCEPSYLFESGVLPLKDLALRGVIWYQGEANAHNAEQYARLFPMLVESWREFWNEPELPFHFVQLSSLATHLSWPHFRDTQRRLSQEIPNVWMTVSSDWGLKKNIHPTNKKPIGERLACSALYRTYHYDHVVPSGPEIATATCSGDKAILSFKYGEGLHASKGKVIQGFEVAGADGIFHEATARPSANGLTVSSPQVKEVHAVRYGWQPYSLGNLVNKVGFPCSTFRVETEE